MVVTGFIFRGILTYLQINILNSVLPDYNFSRDSIKNWGVLEWILTIFGGLICSILLLSHVVLVIRSKLRYYYIIGYSITIVILVGISIFAIVDPTRVVHIHHYYIGAIVVPLTAFMNPVSAACQGLASAVHLDGVSRWGMAPLWGLKKNITTEGSILSVF